MTLWFVDPNPFRSRKAVSSFASLVVEPSLGEAEPGSRIQFERQGYFCVDPDSKSGRLVFNRTATLRDTWAKIAREH